MEKKESEPHPSNHPKHHFYDIAQIVVEKIRSELDSAAHQEFRRHAGNLSTSHEKKFIGIDHPPTTGVIYVMERANVFGYTYGDSSWANFGQGAPEVGHIDGCIDKPTHIEIPESGFEYAPVAGISALREKVANLYNELYRKDKASKYTMENVCIVPGGRAGLTRIASAIGEVEVGYFLPEYTAYEQMLSTFKRFVPIPATLDEENNYRVEPKVLEREIKGRGLAVVVQSNPRNPTGLVIEGDKLKELLRVGRDRRSTMVIDEFYSAYIYTHDPSENGRTVSAAEYIDDVNKDAVIILDGLTKNFRLPGFRVCWIVGPKAIVSAMQSSGSFLEGGANHPLQLAALPLLEPERYKKEVKALQTHFRYKRDMVLDRLKKMGFEITVPPEATFYVWLDLRALPSPINAGLVFFEECLKEKTIVIPGIFFDVNPTQRRELFDSPCHHFIRLSFGPPIDDLKRGLDGIERVIKKFKKTSK